MAMSMSGRVTVSELRARDASNADAAGHVLIRRTNVRGSATIRAESVQAYRGPRGPELVALSLEHRPE
jgi:hypothetical protein